MAGDRDKLIENSELLVFRGPSVPLAHRLQQIVTGFGADCLGNRVLFGSATVVGDFVRSGPSSVTER